MDAVDRMVHEIIRRSMDVAYLNDDITSQEQQAVFEWLNRKSDVFSNDDAVDDLYTDALTAIRGETNTSSLKEGFPWCYSDGRVVDCLYTTVEPNWCDLHKNFTDWNSDMGQNRPCRALVSSHEAGEFHSLQRQQASDSDKWVIYDDSINIYNWIKEETRKMLYEEIADFEKETKDLEDLLCYYQDDKGKTDICLAHGERSKFPEIVGENRSCMRISPWRNPSPQAGTVELNALQDFDTVLWRKANPSMAVRLDENETLLIAPASVVSSENVFDRECNYDYGHSTGYVCAVHDYSPTSGDPKDDPHTVCMAKFLYRHKDKMTAEAVAEYATRLLRVIPEEKSSPVKEIDPDTRPWKYTDGSLVECLYEFTRNQFLCVLHREPTKHHPRTGANRPCIRLDPFGDTDG